MRPLLLVTLLLAACDEDDPVRHLDGGTDSPLPDPDAPPTPQPVKLTISYGGQPQSGVRVYFQNPDSSVVANVMTNAAGIASAEMPNGGFVTAIDPFKQAAGGISSQIRTFAGVKAGDELVLKDLPYAASTVTITAPVDSAQNVANYFIATPCNRTTTAAPGSGAQPTVELVLDSRCSTTDFLVVSLDAGYSPINVLFASGVTVGSTVDLTSRTYAAATSKSYTWNNVPGDFGSLGYRQIISSARGQLWEFSNETGGSPPTSQLTVPTFTGAIDILLTERYGTYGRMVLADWGAFASTFSTDVGARILSEHTGPASFEVGAHRWTWTESATGTAPDFTLLHASSYRSTGALYWVWGITAPYTTGSLAFPVLPVEGSGPDYNFAATDEVSLLTLVRGKVPGGYDAVRGALLGAGGPTDVLFGPSGAMAFTEYEDIGKARVRPDESSGRVTWQPQRRL